MTRGFTAPKVQVKAAGTMTPPVQAPAVITPVERVMEQLDTISTNLTSYTNEALIDFFGAAKPLEKKVGEVNKRAREELLNRREEFGVDAKGHRYGRGEQHGVKLERRVSVRLLEDAEETLAEYLHLFDRELDVKKAEQALREAGVERETYTVPSVTKEQLEKLNEQGLIPDEVAIACLSEESITWAAKPVAPDKMA